MPTRLRLLAGSAAAAGLAATGYMAFEAQWPSCREESIAVPGLPPAMVGLRLLHLSDVHAGQPGFNLRTLRKAVEWAAPRRPDLVLLTGDVLTSGGAGRRCLELLERLKPRLGAYAVTGNHEYGLSKNPFAHRPLLSGWEAAGIRLLKDECELIEVTAPNSAPARLVLCGADYITGGDPLLRLELPPADFAVLLTHRPPEEHDPLARLFSLAFAGHTHGGQIRLPTPWGWFSPHRDEVSHLEGLHPWGKGSLVISRGLGTTFLPFRLFTRPEAVLHTLAPLRSSL